MTRAKQEQRFQELLKEMSEMRKRKNADYATDEDSLSNLRECEDMGIPAWKGTIIRIGDKWSRLKQLTKHGFAMVKGESIFDTLMDTAVYCLLTIILLEEHRRQQRKKHPLLVVGTTTSTADKAKYVDTFSITGGYSEKAKVLG